MAFLISDFIAGGYERSLRLASRRHDLIPVQISDPREETLPDLGLILAEDLESGELIEVDTSDQSMRELYAARVAKDRANREQFFGRLGVDSVYVRTDQDYVRPLGDLFRRRQKRMKGYG